MLSFLVIIPLLDSLRRYFKDRWFSLWCQTSRSPSSHPKMSSVDHSLAIFSLVISDPTTSFSTSSKLVYICYGLSVGVRSSSPAYRLLSWPKIHIFLVSPQVSSLVRSSTLSGISQFLLRLVAPWNPPLWARKVLIGHQNRFLRSVMRYIFCLDIRFPGGGPWKEDHSGIHRGRPPCPWVPPGKSTEASVYLRRPSCCPLCM